MDSKNPARSFMKYPQSLKKINNEKGMVLIIAVMLLAVLVVVGFTALNMTTTDTKISANYREGTRAFYNAEAGSDQVIAYLRDKLDDVVYPTTNAPLTIINGGTCPTGQCITIPVTAPSGITFNTPVNLYCYDIDKKLYLFRVTGTGYNNASRTIEVIIKKIPMVPQDADAAVAMYGGGPEIQFKTGAGGGYAIDGHDYPVPRPTPWPASYPCTGSSCDTTASTTSGVPGVFTVGGYDYDGARDAHLGGVPGMDDTGPSRESQFTEFVNYVVANNLYQTTFGTPDNPAITRLSGGYSMNGNNHHAGILIIEDGGSLNLVGTFTFEGLIILRGNGTIFGAGTGNIFGSLVTISHTAKLIDVTGGVNMFFSSEALANLSKINSVRQAQRISWRDVF